METYPPYKGGILPEGRTVGSLKFISSIYTKMDIEDIIAKKDAEILALKTEIADLKKKLEEKDLEEIVFDAELSEDEEPIVLKLPDEETPNLFQDPNTFMQFMQLMMNNNLQMSQEDADVEEGDELENEEMPELEVIDDIIPE